MAGKSMAVWDGLHAALRRAPIVPVLTIGDATLAAPLAVALQRGGATAVEVTLRTPAAIEAVRGMKAAAPDLLVGAGTVLDQADIERALAAGADFLVSPGTSAVLAQAFRSARVPAIPGVATVSEAMARREEGFALLKLFPAEVAGGAAWLKAIGAPLPDLRFMPTGGITLASLPGYLAQPNVTAVGGSWLVTAADLETGAWPSIETKTRAALAVQPG